MPSRLWPNPYQGPGRFLFRPNPQFTQWHNWDSCEAQELWLRHYIRRSTQVAMARAYGGFLPIFDSFSDK
jgi:hypothetical protein